MTNENLETLNRLAEILGQSGNAIVEEYVVWFVASAILWVIIGFTVATAAWRWTPPEETYFGDWIFPPIFCKWVTVVIGVVMAAVNLPDLIAPKAVSINQILSSIG